MKKFKPTLIAITILSALLFSACGGDTETPTEQPTKEDEQKETDPKEDEQEQKEDEQKPAESNANNPASDENVLYVGTTKHNGVYNYIYASSSYDVQISHLIYDKIIDYSGDGIAKPGIMVDDLSISEDGLTYTVKLKEGITFSDGTPLTANDVLFTYKVLADPSCKAYRISKIDPLKGATEYFTGETEEIEFIKVIDDLTYEIYFKENLRTNIGSLEVNVLSEKHFPGWEKGKSEEVVTAKHTDPLGAGPYVLEKYEASQYTSVVKNENYWAKDVTDYQIPKIVNKFTESTTELDLLIAGEVDVLPQIIDRDFVLRVKDDEDGKGAPEYINLNHYKRSAYGYVLFNNRSGVSSDKLIRQAVTHAIDRELFIEEMYGEYAITIDVPMSQASSIYEKVLDGLKKYPYDLAKAEELIQQAGYTKNGGSYEKDGKKLEFKFLATTNNTVIESLIPVMQDSFAEIGIGLNVEQLEFASMLDYVQNNDNDGWDLAFLASSWPSDEPDTWYSQFYSGNTPNPNMARFNNARFDELILKGKTIIDLNSAEAIECYSEIAMILNDEMPVMPLYANTLTAMINKRVVGLDNVGTFTEWAEDLNGAYIEGYQQ